WEVAHAAAMPAPEALKRQLSKFPLLVGERQFVFDGRAYAEPDDAIAVSQPDRPGEVFVLGKSRRAVLRLLTRRLFYREEDGGEDYRVVSGELSKSGRFVRSAPLAVDRSSDRDDIAAKASFYRALKNLERGGVRWRFRESEGAAVSRWEPVLRKFLG